MQTLLVQMCACAVWHMLHGRASASLVWSCLDVCDRTARVLPQKQSRVAVASDIAWIQPDAAPMATCPNVLVQLCLGFMTLQDLHACVQVCLRWKNLIETMPPIAGSVHCFELAYPTANRNGGIQIFPLRMMHKRELVRILTNPNKTLTRHVQTLTWHESRDFYTALQAHSDTTHNIMELYTSTCRMISACFPNLRFLAFTMHKFEFAVPRDISFGYFLHLTNMHFNVENRLRVEEVEPMNDDGNNDDLAMMLQEMQQTQAVIDDIGVSLPHLTELTLDMPTDRDVNFTSLVHLSKLESFCFTCKNDLTHYPHHTSWLTHQQVQDIRNMPALTHLDLYDGDLNAETIKMFSNLSLKSCAVDFCNENPHNDVENSEDYNAYQTGRLHALRNVSSLTHIPEMASFIDVPNEHMKDIHTWFFDAFPCIETFSCSMTDASNLVPYFLKRTVPALKHMSLLYMDNMTASNWSFVLQATPNLTTLECTYTNHIDVRFMIECMRQYRIPIESLTIVVDRFRDLATLCTSTFFGVYNIPTLSRLTFNIICEKINTHQYAAIERMCRRFQTQLEPDQVRMHAEKKLNDDYCIFEYCVQLDFGFKVHNARP